MPLYPYRCTQCGHRFEKIQHFSAKQEKVCPKCGGALERTLTAPGLKFKGAGWYVNDYAAKGSGSSSDAGPSEKKPASETKPETKTETKTESKTEAKTEAKTGGSGAASPAPSNSSTAPSSTSK